MNKKTALKQLKLLSKYSKKMRLAAEKWTSDFQILISTILSARTRDEVTIQVAERLFSIYKTPQKLATARTGDIKKIIKPVNFYNNKAKNIINCAKVLIRDYHGKVPRDINRLLKLPGVGRKTANVFLSEIGKEGLGVDTHVSYISRKLGWTKNVNPSKIEIDLKKLFPKNYWNKINPTLVRFGKTNKNRKQKDALLEKIKKIK